jgi:hypothetical protein
VVSSAPDRQASSTASAALRALVSRYRGLKSVVSSISRVSAKWIQLSMLRRGTTKAIRSESRRRVSPAASSASSNCCYRFSTLIVSASTIAMSEALPWLARLRYALATRG